jgi:histidine triad (HIT) family protein
MAGDFYCDEALSGHTPVEVVLESQQVLAFHHTQPSYPVHVVVVPRRHVASLAELDVVGEDGSLAIELLDIVRRVSTMVTDDFGACRVITNLGRYQESPHLHFHVVSGPPLDGA